MLRYTQLLFKNDHEPTLAVEFASKVVEQEGMTIKTQIWDTVRLPSRRQDRNPSRPSPAPTTKDPSQSF